MIHLRPFPRLRAYCLAISPQATADTYRAVDCSECKRLARLDGFTDTEGANGRQARDVFTFRERINVNPEALERASAHAFQDAVLEPDACWREGVTDESVARVMYALEAGETFRRNRQGVWSASIAVGPFRLSPIVGEMIRTGLVTHLSARVAGLDTLVPAPVHLERWSGSVWRSACEAVGESKGPKRLRLTADRGMVDCPRCIDSL